MPSVLGSITRKLSSLVAGRSSDDEVPTDEVPPHRERSENPPQTPPARASTTVNPGNSPRMPLRPEAKRSSDGGVTTGLAQTAVASPRRERSQSQPQTSPTRASTNGDRPPNPRGPFRRRRRPSGADGGDRRRQPETPAETWSGTGQFGTLPVSAPVDHALVDMGYQTPTPIQERVIPIVRQGQDVVGQAQTGTGKTAAFGVPIVETVDQGSRHPQALVLTPTRELAIQVSDEISRIGMYRDFKAIAIYGGQPMPGQIKALSEGVQVVVATPGRLMDHMRRRTLSLASIRIAVLDEADEMLDIGFIDDIEYILRQTPRNRQTMLFSATIPYPIKRLARRYLTNPQWIRIGGEAEPVDEVNQVYYEVAAQDRGVALRELLDDRVTRALIFRRTKAGVDWLVRDLSRDGHDAQGIHSDMTQGQRGRVMASFKSNRLRFLVATNVAARGLDIPAVSHVINYDMPDNLEEYVHRIGRTARMGREGTAITFVSDLQDFELLDNLQEHLGNEMKRASLGRLYS